MHLRILDLRKNEHKLAEWPVISEKKCQVAFVKAFECKHIWMLTTNKQEYSIHIVNIIKEMMNKHHKQKQKKTYGVLLISSC